MCVFKITILRERGDDLHILIAKLTSDGTENTSTAHFTLVVQKHHGVIVETDVRSVGTSDLLGRSNYDCLRYSTLLDIARRALLTATTILSPIDA